MLSQAIGDLLAAAAVALTPIPIIAIMLVLDSRWARVTGSPVRRSPGAGSLA
jgi:hypothetical protein